MRSSLASLPIRKYLLPIWRSYFNFLKYLAPTIPAKCWNNADAVECEDCHPQLAKQNRQVELEDYDHHAEIREATEVSAADDTGEDCRSIDEQVHNVFRPLK